MDDALRARIQGYVDAAPVVLFMKGNRGAPRCGFSATVVSILEGHLGAFETHDVLSDAELRDGIKEFSDWPTIPQLYIRGEFVGGSDIVRELDQTGELITMLGDLATPVRAPSITLTDAAAAAIRDALGDADEEEALRVRVDARFAYDLVIDARSPNDFAVESNGVVMLVDRGSARRADGMTIDYVDEPNPGFKIENPNAPASVNEVDAAQFDALRSDGARVVDVRTPAERAMAHIEGSDLLEPKLLQELSKLPKDAPLAFYCAAGSRSRQAAEHFLSLGHTRVYNLRGGITAWAHAGLPTARG